MEFCLLSLVCPCFVSWRNTSCGAEVTHRKAFPNCVCSFWISYRIIVFCLHFCSDASCCVLYVDRSAVSGTCDYDGLHIIKGHNLSSTPLVTICGSETLRPLTIDGPVMLNFYSDAYITDFGFKISYRVASE